MEQKVAPTTGEIVRALRYCVGKDTICGTACPAYSSEAGCRTAIMKNAADRLESQERTIADLTARAESAERERDAAMSFMAAVQSIMSDILLDNIPQRPAITERIRNSIAIWNTYLRGKSQEGGGK